MCLHVLINKKREQPLWTKKNIRFENTRCAEAIEGRFHAVCAEVGESKPRASRLPLQIIWNTLQDQWCDGKGIDEPLHAQGVSR